MKKIIAKVKGLTFEEKTTYSARLSAYMNIVLGIGKIIISIFWGVFFMVAGIMNLLLATSKYICYKGIKDENIKFESSNRFISLCLGLAGTQYAIYMLRLVLWGEQTTVYRESVAIIIATISFIEMGIAISGLFKSKFKGHYYRNIKLINFTSAMTAMVLTMIALLSFASTDNNDLLCGIAGASVGVVIILLAIYMYFAPRFSLIDKEYNVYYLIEGKDKIPEQQINIVLADSFWFGGYEYIGEVKEDKIEGHIIRKKWKFKELNIFIKILLIVLSEILIFVYAIGYVIHLIKNINLISKLDNIMALKNYTKKENTSGN